MLLIGALTRALGNMKALEFASS